MFAFFTKKFLIFLRQFLRLIQNFLHQFFTLKFLHLLQKFFNFFTLQCVTPKCPKKHLPKRYYFWTIIKQKIKKLGHFGVMDCTIVL